MSWSEVPAAPDREERSPVAAFVLGVVPLAVETSRLVGDRWWWLLVLLAGAGFLLTAGARPSRTPALAVLQGAALGGVLFGTGPDAGGGDVWKVAAMATVAVPIAGVATGAVRWLPERLAGGRALVPALAPLIVADVFLLVGGGLRAPALCCAVAALVAAFGVAAPGPVVAVVERAARPVAGPAAALGAVADAVGRFVGRVALWIVLAPAAVLVLAVWASYRLVGHDPLRAPSVRPGGWVVRAGDDPSPERAYSSASVVDQRPPRTRAAAAAPGAVVVLAVAALLVVAVLPEESRAPVRLTERLPARSNCTDDVAPDEVLDCETGQALGHLDFYAPSVFRVADFDGTVVNVRDGIRRTWSPPSCRCRRLVVWWFGGSAAWGEGQRDLHTLASELARAAHRDGVALDVVNFAQPTYTLGQEVRMFSDLTTRRPAPDLVVFYDGGNDLLFQAQRARSGRAADDSAIVLQERELAAALRDGFPLSSGPDPDAPPTSSPDVTDELLDQVADAAMRRYGADADLARRLGRSIGVPVVVAFQPLLAGSPPEAGHPGALDPGERATFERLVAAARERMPARVVDLGDVFADDPEPVFLDMFHTDERGARRIAATLFRRLRAEVPSVQLGR